MQRKNSVLIALVALMALSLWGCGSSRDSDGVSTAAEGTAADPQALFVGSETCQTCHPSIFGDFEESGHPFKLNKVVDGQIPSYPFSTINGALERIADDNGETDNTLGTPASYDDVTYVIGGYGWKARWMDADGYIVTGSEVQYNLEDDSMVAYHNDEVDKPYNCGNCHTTGWRHYDDSLNPNRQDDLPGIDGTFVEAGIGCESCHGPGAEHVATQDPADIVLVADARTTSDLLASDMGYGKAVACSECHTRDGEKDYPSFVSAYNQAFPDGSQEGGRILASGGLIRHHEQYDEMLGVDPDTGNELGKHLAAGVTCVTCHDPHKTIKYQDQSGEDALKVDCDECHGVGEPFEVAMPFDSYMADFDCETCHMPNLAKSAVKHAAVGTGPATGDIATHIFRIDLTQSDQFTADGKFSYPWITKDFACGTCHNGEDAFDVSAFDFTDFTFHQNSIAGEDISQFEGQFANSSVCEECHADNYADFIQSGHPFKLNKVADSDGDGFNDVPTYPFSDLDPANDGVGVLAQVTDEDGVTDNSLGTPFDYDDITYVIGGYGWKARWIDADGFIVTGSTVQYNLEDGSFSAYHDDEVDKPYNCGNCHTTGWKHYDDFLNPNRQDDLPGMDGTFVMEGGIHCESCHGAALLHVVTQDPADVTEVATARTTAELLADDMAYNKPVACSECHTRDGEKDYPNYTTFVQDNFGITEGGRIDASGGLTRHHEQFDEMLGLLPDDPGAGPQGAHFNAGVTCISCHDPHATTKFQDDPANTSSPGIRTDCTDCHGVTFTVAVHGSFDCENCHMPKMVKSAIKTDGAIGANTFGDIRSHIFRVDLAKDSDTEQFVDASGNPDDGGFTNPWTTSKFACGSCHADYLTHVNLLPGGVVHP